jgi:hypothetical protein
MRGRLATVIKRAPLRIIFGEKSGSKRLKESLATPWLSPAKRDRVVPCLDLEDETG